MSGKLWANFLMTSLKGMYEHRLEGKINLHNFFLKALISTWIGKILNIPTFEIPQNLAKFS